ncbi:hypothetical protein [Bifidobacterium myosotis]|uniref:Uncharacterized protein n=1 Tax=Bifidobacterium myosotis TaxID=1630166 RepID=A0A5M9ZKL8_9BIFI|nr:hypothetical protein [Bifidobacterium myosotis]KAA8828114.1 hypothetical protein EMO91_06650 [Bifidobacterium myosotis]
MIRVALRLDGPDDIPSLAAYRARPAADGLSDTVARGVLKSADGRALAAALRGAADFLDIGAAATEGRHVPRAAWLVPAVSPEPGPGEALVLWDGAIAPDDGFRDPAWEGGLAYVLRRIGMLYRDRAA